MSDETRRCRVCGCTRLNCTLCVVRTGRHCHWVEKDLCSACSPALLMPPMRLLQVNECGSKPDWDFAVTDSLEGVVKHCEWHSKLRVAKSEPASCKYLIKDTASSSRLLPTVAREWHVWIEEPAIEDRAATLNRCQSSKAMREYELRLSSTGLLGLLKVAATQGGRWMRNDIVGCTGGRMTGDDLAWLMQLGYLANAGKYVEVTDLGNALVRDLLVFAQEWKGGAEKP